SVHDDNEEGMYTGTYPACASAIAKSRRATNARCRKVSAACSGARNSRKPAVKSRAGSKFSGAELTVTMRFAKGSASRDGLGFVVAVAMICLNPFSLENESGPPEEQGNWEANCCGAEVSKAKSFKQIRAAPHGG